MPVSSGKGIIPRQGAPKMNTVAANPYIPLLARIFLAALFLVSGSNKVMNLTRATAYMEKIGVPMPDVIAIVVAAIELVGAVLVIIGWRTRWVAWAMAIFTVATMLLGHRFWQVEASQFNAQ